MAWHALRGHLHANDPFLATIRQAVEHLAQLTLFDSTFRLCSQYMVVSSSIRTSVHSFLNVNIFNSVYLAYKDSNTRVPRAVMRIIPSETIFMNVLAEPTME